VTARESVRRLREPAWRPLRVVPLAARELVRRLPALRPARLRPAAVLPEPRVVAVEVVMRFALRPSYIR
jgi:hypothetical protein